jgi:RIO-like serine/threonine protein kinase
LPKIYTYLTNKQLKIRFIQWKIIGRGSSSKVYEVRDKNNNNIKRALKIYKKGKFSKTNINNLIKSAENIRKKTEKYK